MTGLGLSALTWEIYEYMQPVFKVKGFCEMPWWLSCSHGTKSLGADFYKSRHF